MSTSSSFRDPASETSDIPDYLKDQRIPKVLAELRRVLVPGGRLLLLEHVAAPPGHWVGRLQQLLQPLWRRAAGGCSIRRDTWDAVVAADFDVTAVRAAMVWPSPPPVAPIVLGAAVSR